MAAVIAAALLLAPAAALAHANLVRSDPPSNASRDQAPNQVQLWFSERPEPKLSEIQVFDTQQRRVDGGPAGVVPDDPQSLVTPLKPNLAPGTYTVNWRTTSAVDGHVTGGAFAFGVGVAPSPAEVALPVERTAGPNFVSGIIRWLSYLSAVGLLGMLLFSQLIGDGTRAWPEGLQQRLRQTGRALAGLMLIAAVAMVLEQTAESSGGQLSLDALQATAATTVGQIMLARLALGAAVFAAIAVSATPLIFRATSHHRSLGAAAAPALGAEAVAPDLQRVFISAALLGDLLLFAMSSHAQTVANAPELALLVDWLHLTLAGVWVGGLLALSLGVIPEFGGHTRARAAIEPIDAQRNRVFGPLVAGFSRVALISALGLAATGFYQALVHIGSLDDALSSDYGRVVIAKTAIFGAALLLGAFHRWKVVPALTDPARAAATRGRRFFSQTLPTEAALALLVLGAAGVLMTLPPANNLEAGGAAQAKTLGETRVTMQVVPLRIGPNQFQVVLRAHGKPLNDAQKVELQFTMLDMDMGQSVLDLEPRGNGVYSAESDTLSMGGRWQVELLLRLPGQFDQRTTFDFTTKP